MQSQHSSNRGYSFGLLLKISAGCQPVRHGFSSECGWSVPSVASGPPGRRVAWVLLAVYWSGSLAPEERGEQPLTGTLQAASAGVKFSWLHKHTSPRSVLPGPDVAEVNLAPGSCAGPSQVRKWPWPPVPVTLVVFWCRQETEAGLSLGTCRCVCVFCPPCRTRPPTSTVI